MVIEQSAIPPDMGADGNSAPEPDEAQSEMDAEAGSDPSAGRFEARLDADDEVEQDPGSEATPGEHPRRLAGPYAVANLWSSLADLGVPPPPLPTPLRPQLKVFGEGHWGTIESDAHDLYLLRPFLEWIITDWDRRPAFVYSHYGKRRPTSWLTLFVAQGPLAVLTQHIWGGSHTDGVHAAADVAATYHAARLLFRRVEDSPARARLLIHHAGFRQVSSMLDLPPREGDMQLSESDDEMAMRSEGPRRYGSLAELFEAASADLAERP